MPFKPLKPSDLEDRNVDKLDITNESNLSNNSNNGSNVKQVAHYSNSSNSWVKPTIYKHSFWLFLIFSAALHGIIWILTPNPLKQTEKQKSYDDIEVVGTVPTVNLPQKNNSNPSKLSQIAKQDLPSPPNNENLESTRSAIVDLPKHSPEKNEPAEVKKTTTPDRAKPDNKPNKTEPPAETVTKKTEPKPDLKNEPNSNQLDDLANKKNAQTDEDTAKDPESQDPSDKQANSTDKIGDRTTETGTTGVTLSQDRFRSEFGKIYAEYAIKYGKENVIQRIIPSPQETTVSQVSQSIEPGINWIPPVEQPKSLDLKGKNTKVTVTLIVAPDGKIEKKWMFSSKNSNVDEIVKKTVKGYENKFVPLEGKIRIVTISYDFPG
jgi:outer membrane biosynthesis protein TonB